MKGFEGFGKVSSQMICGVNVFWNMLIRTQFLLGGWQSKLSRSFRTIRVQDDVNWSKQNTTWLLCENSQWVVFWFLCHNYKQVIWWWIGNKLFSKAIWKVDPQRWRFRFLWRFPWFWWRHIQEAILHLTSDKPLFVIF